MFIDDARYAGDHPAEYADWHEEYDNGETTLDFAAWFDLRYTS